MIIFVKHISIEGPGMLGDFFESMGYKTKEIDLERGERLPEELEGIRAVVVLGGPMNVYEEDKYMYLKEEDSFIKKVLAKQIPFLGICLGAQLLAKAAGARVTKASREEIGFFKVELTEHGRSDIFFEGISGVIDVFQWHEDTFDVPGEGNLLARSDRCVNQAFRVGGKAYGMQFHLEVTENMIREWLLEYSDKDSVEFGERAALIMDRYEQVKKDLVLTCSKICNNFEKIIL